jgi:RimJ/RimL family protein N-acetyltransferase
MTADAPTPGNEGSILETDRVIIRNWMERDRDLLFEINSDEQVMTFFPFRRTHQESDALFERLRAMIAENGLGFYALQLKASGETIGFCGLARTDLEPCVPKGTVEIGWRLATRFWGRGLVTEAAHALLSHGFRTLGLAEIVSFAVRENERSIAVMERIGMRRDASGDFDHPNVPDSHPHLKRHVFYRLTAEEWNAQATR